LKIIGFLFKLLIAALVVLLILQAEYRGRKLKTYVAEYFKSMTASSDAEMEDEVPADDALKSVKKDTKKVEPVKQEAIKHKKQVKVKKVKPDIVDIPEEDREQLQDLLEKEKSK